MLAEACSDAAHVLNAAVALTPEHFLCRSVASAGALASSRCS
jgi:hypothetical protein